MWGSGRGGTHRRRQGLSGGGRAPEELPDPAAGGKFDLLVLVVSTVSPAPNRFVLDKMLAVAEHKGIEPMLAVTKSDLRRDPELLRDYRKAGYRCLELSSATGEGVAELREQLTGGRLVVFSGNTGAGKSSCSTRWNPA
ncbi:MAG: GTPase RsgA [Acutalibacteraceae bacterium]